MIRIRYKTLSPGIHGQAEWSGRGTTVYLLPGLTWGQRNAALRRLRQEASRGYGPALPRQDLAVALAADRFRVGVRNTAAVVRLHPAGSLVPTALAGLLMTLFVLASVSARMAALPPVPPPGGAPVVSGAPTPVGTPSLASATRTGAAAPAGSGARGNNGGAYQAGGARASGRSGAASGSGSLSLAAAPGSGSAAHSQPTSGNAGKPCDPAQGQPGNQYPNWVAGRGPQCQPPGGPWHDGTAGAWPS